MDLSDCLPKWLYHFIFLPAEYEDSKFFAASSFLVLIFIFILAYHSGYTKEARIYNGKKTISLTNGAGKTGQPLVKE